MLKLSLTNIELAQYITKQLNMHFPDKNIYPNRLFSSLEKTLKRAEFCFSHINIKYYFDGANVIFNHLHTDQYAMFLYYLSNTIWQEEQDRFLASKVYYLNKALHSLDVFYEVTLPDIFLLIHPIGTILGRGNFQDYFVAFQRVTIGGNPDLEYPCLGKGLALYAGSAVIGNCQIGDNCLVSLGTTVMDQNIPSDMIVFGNYPEIDYKKTQKSVIQRYFR